MEAAGPYKSLSISVLKDERLHVPEARFIKKLLNSNLQLLRLGPRSFALGRTQRTVWIMKCRRAFGAVSVSRMERQ